MPNKYEMTGLISLILMLNLYQDDSPCSSAPCINGGVCEAKSSTYSCVCPPNTNGTHCEISISFKILLIDYFNAYVSCILIVLGCSAGGMYTCLNGGICERNGLCNCTNGFTGQYCQKCIHIEITFIFINYVFKISLRCTSLFIQSMLERWLLYK